MQLRLRLLTVSAVCAVASEAFDSTSSSYNMSTADRGAMHIVYNCCGTYCDYSHSSYYYHRDHGEYKLKQCKEKCVGDIVDYCVYTKCSQRETTYPGRGRRCLKRCYKKQCKTKAKTDHPTHPIPKPVVMPPLYYHHRQHYPLVPPTDHPRREKCCRRTCRGTRNEKNRQCLKWCAPQMDMYLYHYCGRKCYYEHHESDQIPGCKQCGRTVCQSIKAEYGQEQQKRTDTKSKEEATVVMMRNNNRQ